MKRARDFQKNIGGMIIGGKPTMMAKDPVKYALLLEHVYRGESVTCPECKKAGLQHHFYASRKDRTGFAQFHCPHCDTDAHLCRVKFPDGILTEDL